MPILEVPAMLSREAFVKLQKRDSYCAAVVKLLTSGELEAPIDKQLATHLLIARENYIIEPDGLLVHCTPSHHKRGKVLLQWVVPIALRPLLLKLCHDDASAGHAGVGATHLRMFERYYWSGMAADVRTYVLGCVVCQQNKKAQTTKYKVQLMPPQRMFQRVHLDLVMPLTKSTEGHLYILTVVEARSGFVWLFPLKSKTPEEVAQHLLTVLLEVGHLIEEIITDKGGEFITGVIEDLCKLLSIRRINTSGYHPQSNGVAERMNDRVLQALRNWASRRQNNWHQDLAIVQAQLRYTPREETGLSPFFCVYGREPDLPHGAFMTVDRPVELQREVEEKLELMKLAEEVVSEAFGRRLVQMAKRNEAVKRANKVAVGDWVLVRYRPDESTSRKLAPKFSGPWLVIEKAGDSGLSFTCRMMGRRITCKSVHVEHMKPFRLRPEHLRTGLRNTPITADQLQELPGSEWLERIVDRMATHPEQARGWRYRYLDENGKPSSFVSEADMLKLAPPWVLDSFHALFELRHGDGIPAYAQRPEPPASRRRSLEDALRMFPKGTAVAREFKTTDGTLQYVWGSITGYLHPYWRARYDDGEWEELNATETRQAIALAHTTKERAQQAGDASGKPVVRLMTLPALTDFGARNNGDKIRVFHSGTGWSTGTIVKVHGGITRDRVTVDVLWPGEVKPRVKQTFRTGHYRVNTECPNAPLTYEPPSGTWNLLTLATQTPRSVTEAQAEVASVLACMQAMLDPLTA